ncbi:SDR family NAD(P)-dependent oxidoreductase [Zwartia vadi]|uniref:SDR family NAD(P)-dependent oxidoreductase n=1 Tax=Zwartia vadi TaxID=3058168 RepID=UPI0025B61F2E|nr:SDR family oxidoreductase [Zwartia vadi]MDN3988682.1 SDR family oxidoreductase [Zwartia vadi]
MIKASQKDVKPIDPAYFVPNRFINKTILITGAARGIGRATAIRAAREGANVVIADLLDRQGSETQKIISDEGGQSTFVHADVRNNADNQKMIDHALAIFGSLDFAVNAAGVMDGIPPGDTFDLDQQRDLLFAPIHEASDAYWDQVMAVNITGMFKSMRVELRQMLTQGQGGAIVNVGSIAGLIGLGGSPAYVASKHAVTGITRNAAIDYAPYGIRVNSVNMAGTQTPMTDAAFKKVMALEQERAADPLAADIPNTSMAKTLSLLGISDMKNRMATPWEQASTILYLLSDDASNLTGATWATDGGWTTY